MLLSSLHIRGGDLVCAVGGGGKTSLLHALRRAACERGMTAVITTTTHMEVPGADVPFCPVFDPDRLRAMLAAHGYCVLGQADGRKLSAAPGTDFGQLRALTDLTLCEADGAHRLFCKAPAAHEPVLPPEATLVVGVMGVRALGLPIETGCHRPQVVSDVLGVPLDAALTPEHAALLLCSPRGQRKGVAPAMRYAALVNQADTPERLSLALEVAQGCARRGVRALVTAFRRGDAPLYVAPDRQARP